MIPTIEDIVASLIAGDMDGAQAIHWLNEHKKLAALRQQPGEPQGWTAYQLCDQHKDHAMQMSATYWGEIKKVCPICHPVQVKAAKGSEHD